MAENLEVNQPVGGGGVSESDEEEEELDVSSPTDGVRLNMQQLSLKELEDREAQAQKLFQSAVDFEQRGKVYDALPLYRKAIQLVPDIEFKYYETQKLKNATNGKEGNEAKRSTDKAGDPDDAPVLNLFKKFRKDVNQDYGGNYIQSNCDAGVISTQMHFSDLPPELIFTILRWVVSSQMDMRSLEQSAAVCKGLYLYARDEQLWHKACAKIWGSEVGTLNKPFTVPADSNQQTPMLFTSWRQMFIQRPRVLFNGCYFSKTSYLRVGSNDFQDQFYRPVQLVEYFRYIRFLPDGRVFMMTSTDEPAQGVQKLRDLNQTRPEVLKGYYHLSGGTISIVLKKSSPQRPPTAANRQRRGNSANQEPAKCTKYNIEFRIAPTARHSYGQLVWSQYSIVHSMNRVENTTEFELLLSKYPPLRFGIVRSYDRESEAPLE